MNPTYYSALTNLVYYIQSSCTRHVLVQSFGTGEADDIGITGNDAYPRCFLEQPFYTNFKNNRLEWDLALVVMVKYLQGSSQQEITSKQSLALDITNDLFEKFRQEGIYHLFDEFSSLSMTEFNDDFTASFRTEFKIIQAIPMDRCNISERFACKYAGGSYSAWTDSPPESPVYVGTPVNLFASGGTTYSWTGPNNYTATSAHAFAFDSGTYTVRIYDDYGCSVTASTEVYIVPQFTLVLANKTDETSGGACDGTITLTGTGGYPVYLFDCEGNSTLDGVYTNLCAGDYLCSAIDQLGHEDSFTVTIS